VRRFRPELLLVSSGFDAHYADEIAMQQMSVDGYGALASRIIALADELCGGRVLFAQEGGYHPIALPWCVRRTIELLRGDDPTPDPLGPIDHRAPAGFDAILAEVKKVHAL
jgi:acetoin utilization deacetylase AcuC-like enzyme